MKTFCVNSIRTCLVTTLLMPSLATATLAQDVQVPFLFTDDSLGKEECMDRHTVAEMMEAKS